MAKVKVKTLIGSVVTVAFFLTVIVAFLFYAFPENVASATGFGPYAINEVVRTRRDEIDWVPV
ncbi:hypothetical protein [Escherichia coli]|uniref:hypothetical protein n=1 Tax=Escherichia coli TaxID=562 RepID=UPI003DA3A992